MYISEQQAEQALVGKKLKSVALDSDQQGLAFTLDDGSTVRFHCTADCCSTTWIEALTADDVDGATVLAIEDNGEVDQTSDEEHECLRFYETVFRTDRNRIIVEYRNSSNGFYGGSLELG